MLPEGFQLEAMRVEDYEAAIGLWNRCEGVRANETREEFARILARNPGLSAVVRRGDDLAAAVLCCHDGRRGYLYHLGVAEAYRKRGLGRELVERCLQQLAAQGIRRCTIFVIAGNEAGEAFWKRTGWYERTELKLLARDL